MLAGRHTDDGLANFTDFPLQAARGVDELFITASAFNMTLTKVNYHSLNYVKH